MSQRESTDAESAPLLTQSSHDQASPPQRSFKQIFDPRKTSTYEKSFGAIIIVCFLLSAAFLGLFVNAQHKISALPPSSPSTTTVYTHPHHHTQSDHHITTTSPSHPSPTSPSPPSPSQTICTTPSCVLLSASILSQIDSSVDPCEDPYNWATGGWRARNPLPKSKGVWNSFHLLASQNQKLLLDVFMEKEDDESEIGSEVAGQKEKEEDRAERENIWKLRTVFRDCLDEDHLNSRGLDPLLPILDSIQSLFPVTFPQPNTLLLATPSSPLTSLPAILPTEELQTIRGNAFVAVQHILNDEHVTEDFIKNEIVQMHAQKEFLDDKEYAASKSKREKKLTDVLAFLHSKDIKTVFSFQAQGDVGKDPQMQNLWLYQAPVGLPSREYYSETSIRSFYTHTVASLLSEILPSASKLFPSSSASTAAWHPDQSPSTPSTLQLETHRTNLIATLASRIVSLESDLANAGAQPGDLIDPSKSYNPISFTQLDSNMPINLTDYISFFLEGREDAADVIGADVIVTSKEFVKKMGPILQAEEDWVLQAWFRVRAALEYGKFLGDKVEVRKTVSALENLLAGASSKANREEVCVAHVSYLFDQLAAAEFVQRRFVGDAKQKAEEIITDIVDAFKTRLETIPWMDDKSRAKAIEKAGVIESKIGWPLSPDATSPLAMQRFYAPVKVHEQDFFGNALRAKEFEVKKIWMNEVGKKRDSDSWVMPADAVNAYFSPSDNEIHFPAGILQPPFFGADLPSYITYGSFGAVAAHEITHAFDSSGAQYDAQGFYRQWWTNATFDAFTSRAQCIAKQYSQYWVEGPDGKRVYENGNLTNTEDIGDSGVRFAYRAWKNHVNSTSNPDPILPGLNYTADQLFFAAFGSPWANNISPAAAVAQIRTDEHSIRQFRVLGSLTNFEVFAEVFQCPVGSRMNPRERCELW